jgi:hypothetical protein
MAFDFPANPTPDQVYTDAATGASYKWSGEKWLRQPDVVTSADESPEQTVERLKEQHKK